MTLSFLRTGARHRHRIPRGVPRDLPPHLMRDIGFDPWMRGILENTTAPHQLRLLDVPVEICLARLSDRNRQGEHPFSVTEAHFHQFSSHFAAPSAGEGWNIVKHENGV